MATGAENLKKYIELQKKAGLYDDEKRKKTEAYAKKTGIDIGGGGSDGGSGASENINTSKTTSSSNDANDLRESVSGGYTTPSKTVNKSTKASDYLEGNSVVEPVKNNQPATNESDLLRNVSVSSDGGYDKKNTQGMSDAEKEAIRQAGIRWSQADAGLQSGKLTPEDAERIKAEEHQKAEAIRKKYGFEGGSDGTNGMEGSEGGTVDAPNTSEGSVLQNANNAYEQKHTEGMTTQEKEMIKDAGMRWEQADADFKAGKINEEEANRIKDEARQEAESIRNKYGFSGGDDGTAYNKITTGGEGELAGETTINPETGEIVYTGENEELVNALINELNRAKDDQAFYEEAMKKMLEVDTGVQESDILSYEEALAQAQGKIDPLYDNARDEYSEKMDADAVRRGVFNQLPQEAMKRFKIGQLENERASEIAGLASDLESKSKTEAMQMASQKTQQMQNKLSVLMAGLQASGNASQMTINTLNTIATIAMQREQMDTNREFGEKELELGEKELGLKEDAQDFNQAVTLEELGMKKQQIEQDAVYNNSRIAQSWENISNDRAKIAQASERLGLQRRGIELDENQFKVGIAETAWEMTEKELLSQDSSVEFDNNYYEQLKAQDEQYNNNNGLMSGEPNAMNQSADYLEEIRNQSTTTFDNDTITDVYRSKIDELNAQMGAFDEYQD